MNQPLIIAHIFETLMECAQIHLDSRLTANIVQTLAFEKCEFNQSKSSSELQCTFLLKMKCDVSILSNDSACLFAVSKWSDINHIFWRITNSNHSNSDALIRSVFASVPDLTAFMKHLKLYKYDMYN